MRARGRRSIVRREMDVESGSKNCGMAEVGKVSGCGESEGDYE